MTTGQLEGTDGRLARLCFFDAPLTPNQVTTLDRLPGAPGGGGVVPEPGTLALAGTGLLPLAGMVARRRRAA